MGEATVRLKMLWEWSCTGCGHVNLHRGARMTAEERRDIEEEFEMPADLFIAEPSVVFCAKCEAKFDVAPPLGEPEEFGEPPF